MSISEAHQPDLVAVKSRQRQTWASGDYASVASRRAERGLRRGRVGPGVPARRQLVFRFRSADEFVRFFRDNDGPVHKAFQALDEPGQERLYEDLTALAREHDRAPGPSLAMPSDYLEVVAIRG